MYRDVVIFRIDHYYYALPAMVVREILELMSITELPDLSSVVLGVAPIRKEWLLVLDLPKLLQLPEKYYDSEDSFLVVEVNKQCFGLIADEVLGLDQLVIESIHTGDNKHSLVQHSVNPNLNSDQPIDDIIDIDVKNSLLNMTSSNLPFTLGISRWLFQQEQNQTREQDQNQNKNQNQSHQSQNQTQNNDESVKCYEKLVRVLDPERLLEQVKSCCNIQSSMQLNSTVASNINIQNHIRKTQHHHYLSQNPKDQALFKARAMNLQMSNDFLDQDHELTPMALIQMGSEYFAVELAKTRGISDLHQITRIPSCPPHILGMMNLRGEGIVIVDIQQLLSQSHEGKNIPKKQVLILDWGNEAIGVAITAMQEIVHFNLKTMGAVPVTLSHIQHPCALGTIFYENNWVTIMDFTGLLSNQDLVVYQTV